MEKITKVRIGMWVCFFVMFLPLQGFAYIYDYNLSGYYKVGEGVNNVSGIVSVSDSFDYYENSFYFKITNFSLHVTGPNDAYTFSGDDTRDGGGYLVWVGVNRAFDHRVESLPFETEWFLNNSNDYWNNVYSVVRFYDAAMNWYQPVWSDNNYFGMLAPYIEMGGAPYISQLEDPQSVSSGSLWLERTPPAAPVPEPLSIILLSAGICILGFAGKRLKKYQHSEGICL